MRGLVKSVWFWRWSVGRTTKGEPDFQIITIQTYLEFDDVHSQDRPFCKISQKVRGTWKAQARPISTSAKHIASRRAWVSFVRSVRVHLPPVFAVAANVGNAGSDRSMIEGRSMSGMGRE